MNLEFLNSVKDFQLLLLVMIRMVGMFVVSPFFSSSLIPMRIRVSLAFVVSIVVYAPVKDHFQVAIPEGIFDFGFLALNEIIVGLTIGFFVGIIFTVFQLAGQFFSLQMGYEISQVLDPLSQVQIPLIGQFLALFGVLVFLAMGGHLLMIATVIESYEAIPTLDIVASAQPISLSLIDTLTAMFGIALKLGFPVVSTIFLITLALGLLAKFAPQMNIMMLGFPIYIFIGFVTLILIIPGLLTAGREAIMNQILFAREHLLGIQ